MRGMDPPSSSESDSDYSVLGANDSQDDEAVDSDQPLDDDLDQDTLDLHLIDGDCDHAPDNANPLIYSLHHQMRLRILRQ